MTLMKVLGLILISLMLFSSCSESLEELEDAISLKSIGGESQSAPTPDHPLTPIYYNCCSESTQLSGMLATNFIQVLANGANAWLYGDEMDYCRFGVIGLGAALVLGFIMAMASGLIADLKYQGTNAYLQARKLIQMSAAMHLVATIGMIFYLLFSENRYWQMLMSVFRMIDHLTVILMIWGIHKYEERLHSLDLASLIVRYIHGEDAARAYQESRANVANLIESFREIENLERQCVQKGDIKQEDIQLVMQ